MKLNVLKFGAATAGLVMLAGCIVLSVYPYYSEKDLIFDPGLAGRWAKEGSTNVWQFTSSNEKSYILVTTDSNDTNGYYAHLFKLNEFQFLDLLTTNRPGQFQMPLHLVSEVSRTDAGLSLRFLDYGWLTDLLQANPAILRHLIVLQNPDQTNSDKMLYLTATTRDLQKFLLKYASDTNAFSSSSTIELKRVSQ